MKIKNGLDLLVLHHYSIDKMVFSEYVNCPETQRHSVTGYSFLVNFMKGGCQLEKGIQNC